MTQMTFQAAFDRFMSHVSELVGAKFKDHPTLKPDTVGFSEGRKYRRVYTCPHGDRKYKSAYAFVCLESGNILKPDGWKRPAKHARGNIFRDDFAQCLSPYGVAYLR